MSKAIDVLSAVQVTAANHVVLAECAYAGSNFSRFEPLLRLGARGWERIKDAEREYPDEGKIFCFDPKTFDAAKNSVWVFAIEPNLRIESAGKKRDRFLARDASPATRVIDLSTGSWEEARRKLVEAGLPASAGVFPQAFVILSGQACVRLRFTFDAVSGTLRAEADDLANLPVFRCDRPISAGHTVDGAAYLIPGTEPPEIVEHVDWCPDDEFLPKVLRRIKRVGFGDREALTHKAIEALTAFHRASGTLAGDDPALQRMRRRLQDFLPRFKPDNDQLEAIVAAVEAHRPIAERLERAFAERQAAIEEDARARIEVEIRAQLEADHAAAAARIEAALKDAAEAEEMRREATAHVEAIRTEAAALEAALITEVAGLREALAAAPAGSSGRAQAIARAASAALRGAGEETELIPSALPPWAKATTVVASSIGPEDLVGRLGSAAKAAGIHDADLLVLDAFLRAGEVVAVFGRGSTAVLSAYARCVSAGRVTRFALDPSVIGLDDLWRQAGTGAPTPFALAWNLARSRPTSSVLLVLDAFNAAPFEFWLPALADILMGVDRPKNLLVAATASAARWTGHMAVEDFVRSVLPFALSSTPDAVRAALREVGQAAPGEAAAYDGSRCAAPDASEIAGFMASLVSRGLDDDVAAARATRAFVTARTTHTMSEAVSLALEVASFARSSSTPAVAPLAQGLEKLRSLMPRERE
jgi:hypothetical protein